MQSYEELKLLFDAEIEEGNYAEAKKIKEKMEQLKVSQPSDKIKQVIEKFQAAFDEELEKCRANVQKAAEYQYARELNYREQLSNQFTQLAKEHVIKLTKMETAMYEHYVSTSTPDKRVVKMLKDAQKLANKQQFDEAQEMKENAEELKNKIDEQALETMEKNYETYVCRVLDQFHTEIDTLINNNKITPEMNEDLINKQRDTNKVLLDIFVRKFLKDVRPTLSIADFQVVKERINQIYEEQTGRNISQNTAARSPRNSDSLETDKARKKSSQKHFISKKLDMKYESRASKRFEDRRSQAAFDD
ncbi:hypothetical protein TVAG_216370 [Trichomonas vaginalis G3]|uniref:Uncharacterized protein n=1 Tax=Trichomonas vaginalis (strain ATCC PRA-98 / G3) TaxID=412133 RepID=A2ENX1_TRIV3|nr:hypothetical protein TVAGG3_0249540 [Trichomonas vaginalis G3]EAY05661.1 hypothetical protein TVAG_216370 [Trichomonas vaginalis G3]KAI5553901.1 hypothetical protein TVAGG3_0249540 [Trichomonas vaginalis G3]|eukprot:XP_001317884.1 hypothetical protein [Trichomonas vaginalis G3]